MNVFAARLRQYAIEMDNIVEALLRVKDCDDNYSPSKHTPSRKTSREALHKLSATIHGYCIAVDDSQGLSHGTTEARFDSAMKADKHRIKPYEEVDSDAGYPTMLRLEAESKADDAFEEAILGLTDAE